MDFLDSEIYPERDQPLALVFNKTSLKTRYTEQTGSARDMPSIFLPLLYLQHLSSLLIRLTSILVSIPLF